MDWLVVKVGAYGGYRVSTGVIYMPYMCGIAVCGLSFPRVDDCAYFVIAYVSFHRRGKKPVHSVFFSMFFFFYPLLDIPVSLGSYPSAFSFLNYPSIPVIVEIFYFL